MKYLNKYDLPIYQHVDPDIFFLQKDNTLIEGIGEQKDDNGQMKYANENKINYNAGHKLKTTDCKIVTEALK